MCFWGRTEFKSAMARSLRARESNLGLSHGENLRKNTFVRINRNRAQDTSLLETSVSEVEIRENAYVFKKNKL